jgi:DNA mismatch repair protein MutS2
MKAKLTPGDTVQTPLGKGVVEEVRNGGRVLVQVHGRRLVISHDHLLPSEPARRSGSVGGEDRRGASYPERPSRHIPAEVDLHGLTVDQALQRAEEAISEALIADLPELRLIHGKSGGRIRTALLPRLRALSCVRAVRLDPTNPGVTIVTF